MKNENENEENRLRNIFNSAQKKYSNLQEIERKKNMKILSDILKDLKKKMFSNAKILCKTEYEDFSKYVDIDSEKMVAKPNVERKILENSAEKFNFCFNEKYKEINKNLEQYKSDFTCLNDFNQMCLKGFIRNSKKKSDTEIENGFLECFRKYDNQHNNLFNKYSEIFNKIKI